jgi:hypothetical protein
MREFRNTYKLLVGKPLRSVLSVDGRIILKHILEVQGREYGLDSASTGQSLMASLCENDDNHCRFRKSREILKQLKNYQVPKKDLVLWR